MATLERDIQAHPFGKYRVDVPEGESGRWRVERFTVEPGSVGAMLLGLHGRGLPPGTYTRLMRGSQLVMSDTPAEVRDHREVIRRATGRVLLNGLGIGMVLRAVLAENSVTHVDVVEASEDVIRLVGPAYAADPRVHIHHADAYAVQWPAGTRWDVVWHDIWDDICADNLPQMHRLHRKYGRRCGWQGSWARHLCERGH